MAVRVVRWGVLGGADIALRRVIPAIHAAVANEIAAIASRDLERAREAARQLHIERAYGSYEALLDDADVDAVYIPLPNSLHAEWTIRSAEHGKHVLCEKPMATTVVECTQMVEACRRAGVTFMEGFMYHFHPQYARVRALIDAGAIGEPRVVRSSFCVRMQRSPEDIRYAESLGGGALLDVGVYAIDAVRWLLGADPVSVSGRTTFDSHNLDLSSAAVLAFADDALATMTCSFVASGGGSYEVLGQLGKITVHHAFAQPANVGARVSWETPEGPGEELFPPNIDQHRLMVEAYSAAILSGQPPPISDDAGIGNIAIIESLRRRA
jgi:xylose dehydrogenase (NAD/NADP)